MILYHAADLLWSTRIKTTAEDLGLFARPVRNIEMLNARLADSSPTPTPTGLILDLETGETALQLLMHLREVEAKRNGGGGGAGAGGGDGASGGQPPQPPPPQPPHSPPRLRVVAFGPHIAKDLLARAREAGADEVLTRGAFDHHLAEVLRRIGESSQPCHRPLL